MRILELNTVYYLLSQLAQSMSNDTQPTKFSQGVKKLFLEFNTAFGLMYEVLI